MNDLQLRCVVRRALERRHRHRADTLIVDEFGVRHGAARVDIAVVNGTLHGYELKSDRDTLDRLPAQVDIYGSVLERITLVSGQRHKDAAALIIPDWWGIVVATTGPRGGIRLRSVRQDRPNPGVCMEAVAKLLWREEALAILERMSAAGGVRSATRRKIYARLLQHLSGPELLQVVRDVLRARTGWRSA